MNNFTCLSPKRSKLLGVAHCQSYSFKFNGIDLDLDIFQIEMFSNRSHIVFILCCQYGRQAQRYIHRIFHWTKKANSRLQCTYVPEMVDNNNVTCLTCHFHWEKKNDKNSNNNKNVTCNNVSARECSTRLLQRRRSLRLHHSAVQCSCIIIIKYNSCY